MPTPLLETKLHLPRTRADMVPRPRLSERLDRGARARLTLVSAPAGFGKTSLLAAWLATRSDGPTGQRSTAWVSLDRGDNDPARFWTYVIAALRTIAPDVGAKEIASLASAQPPPIELLLTTLLNDLGDVGDDLVLVLDDFHVIESLEIQDEMEFLLDRMPARLHLVIATRADPALPLGRLRGRGELLELRAADLRFTEDEAAEYLNGATGLELTKHDVTALEERTEGWIAALQLAALSMQGRDDVAGFIAGFTGDDRYIVDYLVEEVLQRQPPGIREFLLQTSILGRLNGALCDATTGKSGSKARLEALDRGNLFVVPLDDRRHWYRYHHLFADVLRARLSEESPELVQVLHGRASDWYAEHAEPTEAIEHALAGGHFDRAADLFEVALPALRPRRQEATLRGWLELLPDEVLELRPVLSNSYAGALLATGEVEGVERRLQDAERWLDTPGPEMVIVDEQEGRRVPAGVAIHRAGLSLMTGDLTATVAHAQRALNLLEDDDDLGHGAATALIGLASWASGDLATAHDAYAASIGNLQRAGHISDLLGCSIALADLEITQGRLRDATHTYERALKLAGEQAGSVLRGTADMYVGLSAIRLERNDLAAATQLLVQSEELGEYCGLPQNPYRWRVAMARIREAEGNLGEAVDLLDEAESAYVGDFSPNVRPVPATRARVWLRQGKVDEALDWARRQGLSSDDDLNYVREYEHITLARALLASGEHAAATALIGRLLDAAQAGQRTGSIIEIRVLQALAHGLGDDREATLEALGHALTLAEPEGYVRVFVDEGPAMVSLLKAVAPRTSSSAYVDRLLAACAEGADRSPIAHGLVDPLSQRELDVLRLLGSDLAGPEIARELFVSLNTVRTHTKSIYAKLGVNNRRAAVRRAAELDM